MKKIKLKQMSMKITFYLIIAIFFSFTKMNAQTNQMVRIAKLIIDFQQLDNYKMELKEEIEKSIQNEPGVINLYAVSEKEDPTKITIIEIYADKSAYEKHIKSVHFLKYKNATANMVKSLELIEVDPLIPDMKIK